MASFRDLDTGLPDEVERQWGYPRLVTYETTYRSTCGCSECEYHTIPIHNELSRSEWYWKPTVVDMSAAILMLEANRSALVSYASELGKGSKDTHD